MPTSLRAALAAATMAPKDKDDDPREDKDFRRALRGKFRNVHKTVHGASPALGPARPDKIATRLSSLERAPSSD